MPVGVRAEDALESMASNASEVNKAFSCSPVLASMSIEQQLNYVAKLKSQKFSKGELETQRTYLLNLMFRAKGLMNHLNDFNKDYLNASIENNGGIKPGANIDIATACMNIYDDWHKRGIVSDEDYQYARKEAVKDLDQLVKISN